MGTLTTDFLDMSSLEERETHKPALFPLEPAYPIIVKADKTWKKTMGSQKMGGYRVDSWVVRDPEHVFFVNELDGMFGVLEESKVRPIREGLKYPSEVISWGDFLIVCESWSHRLLFFDAAGSFCFELGGHGRDPGTFEAPVGLAVDGNDRLWVCDYGNRRLQCFEDANHKGLVFNIDHCFPREDFKLGPLFFSGKYLSSDSRSHYPKRLAFSLSKALLVTNNGFSVLSNLGPVLCASTLGMDIFPLYFDDDQFVFEDRATNRIGILDFNSLLIEYFDLSGHYFFGLRKEDQHYFILTPSGSLSLTDLPAAPVRLTLHITYLNQCRQAGPLDPDRVFGADFRSEKVTFLMKEDLRLELPDPDAFFPDEGVCSNYPFFQTEKVPEFSEMVPIYYLTAKGKSIYFPLVITIRRFLLDLAGLLSGVSGSSVRKRAIQELKAYDLSLEEAAYRGILGEQGLSGLNLDFYEVCLNQLKKISRGALAALCADTLEAAIYEFDRNFLPDHQASARFADQSSRQDFNDRLTSLKALKAFTFSYADAVIEAVGLRKTFQHDSSSDDFVLQTHALEFKRLGRYGDKPVVLPRMYLDLNQTTSFHFTIGKPIKVEAFPREKITDSDKFKFLLAQILWNRLFHYDDAGLAMIEEANSFKGRSQAADIYECQFLMQSGNIDAGLRLLDQLSQNTSYTHIRAFALMLAGKYEQCLLEIKNFSDMRPYAEYLYYCGLMIHQYEVVDESLSIWNAPDKVLLRQPFSKLLQFELSNALSLSESLPENDGLSPVLSGLIYRIMGKYEKAATKIKQSFETGYNWFFHVQDLLLCKALGAPLENIRDLPAASFLYDGNRVVRVEEDDFMDLLDRYLLVEEAIRSEDVTIRKSVDYQSYVRWNLLWISSKFYYS